MLFTAMWVTSVVPAKCLTGKTRGLLNEQTHKNMLLNQTRNNRKWWPLDRVYLLCFKNSTMVIVGPIDWFVTIWLDYLSQGRYIVLITYYMYYRSWKLILKIKYNIDFECQIDNKYYWYNMLRFITFHIIPD